MQLLFAWSSSLEESIMLAQTTAAPSQAGLFKIWENIYQDTHWLMCFQQVLCISLSNKTDKGKPLQNASENFRQCSLLW